MTQKILIDEKECTGCEYCVDSLPAVFTMNNEGVCVVQNSNGATEKEIQEVIDNCPAECIHWNK